MRIVIEIRAGQNPEVILNNLYSLTPLESAFGVNNVALVNKTPKLLNLKELLEIFISHRRTVVSRRTEFELNKAKDRGLEPYWTINHGWITGMYYKDPDGNLVELFFEHWTNDEEYKNEISARGFPEEPVGTNMDIDILYQMYKNGESLQNLTKKGNTVPEGKKPVSGIQAAINMRKKFK